MDHQVATRTHAVERYLLGEMPEQERDDFEAHYFSCLSCAEDVKAGSALVEDAKVILRENPEPVRERAGWLGWLRPQVLAPAFAAFALAAVTLYQNTVTLPALRAPQSIAPAVILDGVTRDSLPQVRSGSPLRFQMALDGAAAGERVTVELLDASGSTVRKGAVSAPGPNRALDVFFPGSLEAGRYTILVRSSAGTELARNLFRATKETTAE